ncbi:uncharacterized protein OCT59_015201 [Rhizophagus irregularis]|uniref:uncharacterized protein n=1 Tax=Rhizophagus irregularis TaxID=588596 RepID=UPI00332A1598|nr:hypothetical protein OCT59_015201 [Rhizophagus irregularis]
MEEFKLSDDVFEKIKDFNYWNLTNKQEFLIDKLILNEELKERYKSNGLCEDCKQPKTDRKWCKSCNSKHFQQNFKNWTSGNNEIDKLIQKAQLNAKENLKILEWIEYDRFENVEYLAKGGFGTIYKAIWKDGYISEWDFENNQWIRSKYYAENYKNFPVVLKCLHNSQDITVDFLREDYVGQQIPKAQELYKLVDNLYDELYNSNYDDDSEIKKQAEEAVKFNEKFTSSSLPYNGTTLLYTTNPQAVYTSRLLDFKNLPEPKNAVDDKDDDNSFEYLEAIDFTKLNLDKNS